MLLAIQKLTHSSYFQNFITAVILVAGVVVGLETSKSIMESHHGLLHILDQTILWIFVAEAVLKLTAAMPRPWEYFKDPWNIFDFTIIVVSFMPFDGHYITVLRLARLLRVLRLVRFLPGLQLLVSALLKSIPSMGYVGLLLGLTFYLYAVAGVFIFGQNDPVHFGSLPGAFMTLFQTVTLEGWIETFTIQKLGCAAVDYPFKELCTQSDPSPVFAPIYFISFILIGTMVVLNLFIGVIMSSMEEAQQERAEMHRDEITPAQQIEQLEKQVAEIGSLLKTLKKSV